MCLFVGACEEPPSGSGELPAKERATAAPIPSAAPTSTSAAPATAEPSSAAASAAPAATTAQAGADAPKARPIAPSATADVTPTASATAAASTPTVAASATAAPALTVQSAPVQEAAFSVWMSSAKSYKVGQTGYVEAVVVPKGDYHCNESYPYKIKLGAAPAGVSFSETIVRGASVSAARASIRVPFTPTAAGDARISGKLHFSVCRADQCVIDAREVAATVKIE